MIGSWLRRSLIVIGVGLLVAIIVEAIVFVLVFTPEDRARLISRVLWVMGVFMGIAAWRAWTSVPRDVQKVVVAVAATTVFVAAAGIYSSFEAQVAYERQFNIYWQEPNVIEQYLLDQTPVGTSEESVITWLQNRGKALRRNLAIQHPSPNQIEGVVDIYQGRPFAIWVTANYTFDDSHRLVTIKVTKKADAL